MTAVTNFIAELIRAANDVGKVTPFERRRLLERAVTTIRETFQETGVQPSETGLDKVMDLQTLAASIATVPDAIFAHALLEAADMIRTLKIMLDGKEEILRGDE